LANWKKLIDRLTAEALILIANNPDLQRILTMLTGIKNIAKPQADS